MPISNCYGEMPLSFFKRIKNRLRSFLKKDAWGVLSIENDITANINFEKVIDAFTEQNARGKTIKDVKIL